MSLFAETGGLPCQVQDTSTGIFYVAASFDAGSGTENVLIARQDGGGATLTWADGTTEKTVIAGTATAGRPTLLLNRYDPEQSLLLRHGDRKFIGYEGGERWEETF